ncbi:MAG: DUF2508 family protein [Lachnospiraceae bacterium]|nr:DUF2508 family protein [Lachnospiraceae bacterium]
MLNESALKHLKNRKNISDEGADIITAINKIKTELERVKMNFDLATDEALIDSYIFELISLNKKYEYFLNLAKENGIIMDGYKKIV